MGHYQAARRFYTSDGSGDAQPPKPTRPVPNQKQMMADMLKLFQRDLSNVELGIYPEPFDGDVGPRSLLSTSRKFFADLPEATRRRQEGGGQEVFTDEMRDKLPRYFLQNFHFQSGGYLTEDSAEIYDMQVEVLFSGTANAMRRQALVPVHDYISTRRQQDLQLLDVACGTGRFLKFTKAAFPRLTVTGVDLSHAYAQEARNHLRRRRACSIITANAEHLPFADASQDLITCIFLFHELPPKVRRIIAAEIARVLKPGGRFVLVDSLQFGDVEDYDGLLELFPARFHEPFFSTYVEENFEAMFNGAGLVTAGTDLAFMSKVMSFDKPE